jgi:hypothetical protein
VLLAFVVLLLVATEDWMSMPHHFRSGTIRNGDEARQAVPAGPETASAADGFYG